MNTEERQKLTISGHARLEALVEAAATTCVPIALVDVAVAAVLTANPCGVAGNDGSSEEGLTTQTGRNAVVVSSCDVVADGAERAFVNGRS